MKYLIQWRLLPSTTRAAAQHFLKTGGQPPEGATLVGRWFTTSGRGCVIVEASDAQPIFELVTEWQEFLEIEATPAIDDDAAGPILSRLYG